MDIIEALRWRYAVKKFDSNAKLTEAQINKLLEALRLTATSFGLQLMKFAVIEDKTIREKLLPTAFNQMQVLDASHLIVLCRNTSITEDEINEFIQNISSTRSIDESDRNLQGFKKGMLTLLDRDDQSAEKWLTNQVYLAMGTLLTTCAAEKVDACPMEGFIGHKVDEILALQKYDLKSVLLCPVGYRSAEDEFSKIKKVRKSSEDIILNIPDLH